MGDGDGVNIKERMIRKEPEDIIQIGMALESFYNSDAGEIVRCIANAITTKQFTGIDDNQSRAEKKLGRAEGISLLITDIELAIDDMRRYTAEIKEEQKVGG